MNSVMQRHSFNQVPRAEIERSSFDRSHGHKTTFSSGLLIPVYLDEILPGDSINLRMSAFARLATPLKPVMDNMYLESFFFFVPARLVWENWQKFQGERANPSDSTDFLIPTLDNPTFLTETIGDYYGLPLGVPLTNISVLPFRCYNLIYNEWFRKQDIVNSTVVNTDDGPEPLTNFTLKRRMKKPDYFSSALPFPQKGPDVLLPLGVKAPVLGIGVVNTDPNFDQTTPASILQSGGVAVNIGTGGDPAWLNYANINSATAPWVVKGANGDYTSPDIYANLEAATSAKINQLRQAFQLQRLFERDARSGTRYYESIKAFFGVTDPGHAVLQRPIYLGGGSSPINMHPVAQSSGSAPGLTGYSDTPQGNLGAYATVSANGHGFSHSFTEHGFVLGLINVRADITYQRGVRKLFSRRTRYDHYLPVLAHLGEQPITNKEIYAIGTSQDDLTFGYVPRWDEYRYFPSQVTGKFRSTDPQSLDFWHLSQDFGSLPTLNTTFIEDNPPISRVIAVPSEPEFIFDSFFKITHARPMPTFGVPGYIDHF